MEVAESISKTLEQAMSIQLVKVLLLEPLELEAIMLIHQEDNYKLAHILQADMLNLLALLAM